MSIPTRIAPRLRPIWSSITTNGCRRFTSTPRVAQEEWPQRAPLGLYYGSVLNAPSPYPFEEKPEEPPNSADPKVLPPGKNPVPAPSPPPTKKKPGRKPDNEASASPTPSESTNVSPPEPSPPPTSAQEKARIIFGSRLLGPAEEEDRLAVKSARSSYLAGVLVPPQPEEPDNCCMSGCVNCVWDLFREEMEEWTAKKNEAQQRMQASSGTVDTDGGGSEANWVGSTKIAKDMWDEDVLESVPVGIREFMKQEKRLKERHRREGTVGG